MPVAPPAAAVDVSVATQETVLVAAFQMYEPLTGVAPLVTATFVRLTNDRLAARLNWMLKPVGAVAELAAALTTWNGAVATAMFCVVIP